MGSNGKFMSGEERGGFMHNEVLIEKLIAYIDALDSRISVYKDALPGMPEHIVQRLKQYSVIVSKQRILAASLKQHIAEQNWAEVCRHVQLIKGLSTMVREDAQSLFAEPYRLNLLEKDKQLLC